MEKQKASDEVGGNVVFGPIMPDLSATILDLVFPKDAEGVSDDPGSDTPHSVPEGFGRPPPNVPIIGDYD